MFEYIHGKVVSKQPTHVVLETGGIGYLLNITLNSFEQIKEGENQKIFAWLQVTEDAHRLWGFHNPAERDVFLHLISVSGIGPNTARLILSGMSPEECRQAIITDNELAFKQVKGVGPKTAKRLMMELKDKMLKTDIDPQDLQGGNQKMQSMEEAQSALVTLGFMKSKVEKVISQIVRDQGGDIPTETLVRLALRMLSA
jgi:Holliday junction DNA helicase RuvA